MKVTEIRRKAYVINLFEEQKTILQSYNSTVVVIDRAKDTITLGRHWDYSNTTLKHIYSFLEEYATDLPYAFFTSKTKKRSIENMIQQNLIQYDDSLI